MTVVYVAGPFRAMNERGDQDMWRVQQNVMAAMNVALKVWKLGAVALCPHANSMFFTGAGDDAMWLNGSLELMRRCDAVVLVSGWEQSQGTLAEIREAQSEAIPVFESVEELKGWLGRFPDRRHAS